eukprot:CAMPEP_0182537738 /NCGR_PEP_ID=MMETSP1323-20130603/22513_1 /TAXON_ID=236787 /ORGANISM="Florenciella parvula, Strain RCC1693" /LENGTH=61 /DNA_ID=CAMNT_0024748149 /DNA_START=131 /DNA_END=316 /DNA_ORIENTATION=-
MPERAPLGPPRAILRPRLERVVVARFETADSPGMTVHVVVYPFKIDIVPTWIVDFMAQLER